MDKIVNMYLYHFLENETKLNYDIFLNKVIGLIEDIMAKVDDYLYKIIYDQLIDIRLNVINSNVLKDYDEINERYNLGGLAIKNFEENDELRIILVNVFRGALHYSEFPEK